VLNPFFYIQAIFLALGQIWVNKTRSFLTALGIIIGVASVTAVIAALSGLKTKVLSEFESFGATPARRAWSVRASPGPRSA
jgi:putative ABC transport system permease protein